MRQNNPFNAIAEMRGGFEASLQGISSAIGPVVFFMGLFGAQSLAAGFWATLVTASVVPLLSLLLRGQSAILTSSRTASLAAYAGLVLHLSLAGTGTTGNGLSISPDQLRLGLAAGSLMFFIASVLVMLSGFLKFGNVFKMIPIPVISGISNGTALLVGWLALRQLFHNSGTATVVALAMVAAYFLWQRLLAYARTDSGLLRYVPNVLVALGVGVLLTLVIEPASHAPVNRVTLQMEWVSMQMWPALFGSAATAHMVAVGLPSVVALALVMILETFTAVSVMESRFGVRSDANRELVVLGGANILSAALGGVPSTGSPLRSVANWTNGGRGRLAYLACLGLTSALVYTLGGWLMALPVGIVAGLLLLQMPVIADRLFVRRLFELVGRGDWRRWRQTGTVDQGFWITLVISLVGVFGNLIWACLIGIVLSTLAVLRRVSESLTAQWGYLDQYRSRRVRTEEQIYALMRSYRKVGVLRLTGHLFFGNSTRLAQLVDELHRDANAVVIDVSEVHEADPTGLGALQWLIRTLAKHPLAVLVSGLDRTRSAELRKALEALPEARKCVDLDRGLEICEDQLLLTTSLKALPLLTVKLEHNELLQGLSVDEITEVLLLGEPRKVAQGEALFYKDAPADGVWLLQEGAVSILSGDEYADSFRLATVGPGQFVGEMGFIDGKPRSATARADSPVRALLLDKRALQALVERQPDAALKITRTIAHELSIRVRNSSAWLINDSAEASSGWAKLSNDISQIGALTR